MKITRHAAPDMRQALRLVREQLGPDAVILSSKRTAVGVEVTAAMDFDAQVAQASPSYAATEQPALRTQDRGASRPAFFAAGGPAVADEPAMSANEAMSNELRIMRRMLETQLAQLAWNDLTRRAPIQIEILRELTEIGLAPDLAAEVAAKAPANTALSQSRRFVITALSERVLVTGNRWLEKGGKVALVGPTGVGKTTTLAKLAVRWVLNHGPRDLALVAADSVRLGAQDQVQSLGHLLGARVYKLDDLVALPALLTRLAKNRCVLIDTPGSSQRDTQLTSRLGALSASGPDLEIALVLAASTQAGAIEETVRRFAPAKPTSCVLTKVDEAASLGGILSALTRAKLPISYVSEGQRVPEDLHPARALELVSRSIQLAQTSGAAADEDMLRRRFGEVAHALA